MKPDTLYIKNLERFARFSPLEAYRLDDVDCSDLNFCYTKENELNLVVEYDGSPLYLHKQEGAHWEARLWSQILPLETVDVLYVYGLGLGYYYLPLKEWLLGAKNRYLVFIEEDPRVVRRFLQSQLASEILDHPQVMVRLFSFLLDRATLNWDDLWERVRVQAAPLIWTFAEAKFHVSALQSYFRSRFEFFHRFDIQWHLNVHEADRRIKDFSPQPIPNLVIENMYANSPYLAEAVRADQLFGAFQSIPAIICGAGPSLSKQLPLLAQLKDKALIFGAGSGMNAVTRSNIIPHAGGAIDPFPAQASRQMTSFANDVPMFYQNRFYSEALKRMHGPRLYVNSSKSTFRLMEWFEMTLGLESDSEVLLGVSTSNYLIEIAAHLGCNPIILIGMDLAYTNDVRYAKEVAVHPTDNKKEQDALTFKEDNLFQVAGFDGHQVYTKHEWFREAICMIAFTLENPDKELINCTEGGMFIQDIPNLAFKEVVDKHLKVQWEMQGWLHGHIQNASCKRMSESAVIEAIKTWCSSLERCQKLLKVLKSELLVNKKRLKAGEKLDYGSYTGLASLWQIELEQEVAYNYLLKTLDVVFDTMHKLDNHAMKFVSAHKCQKRELALEIKRCVLFQGHIKQHLKAIKAGMKAYKEHTLALSRNVKKDSKRQKSIPPVEYISNGFIQIDEPDLGVSIKSDFRDGEGRIQEFYPNGTIKVEALYREGRLHGPWTFFNNAGGILVRTWYIDGQKQGKSCYYYLNGAIYSIRGYKNDFPQGEHFCFYQNGILKSHENYDKGCLHGIVQLYYSNGQLEKENHFFQGKLHGRECMWNEAGQMVLEAFYENNQPAEIARRWDAKGKLVNEIQV